eukprot:6195957-Pleurochrysis_carterae.AAC.2
MGSLRFLGASRMVVSDDFQLDLYSKPEPYYFGAHVQPHIWRVHKGRFYMMDTGMSKWTHELDTNVSWSKLQFDAIENRRETLEIAGDRLT